MDKIKCECRDCGKTFNKGDEGDNEKFCLRCERIAFHSQDFSKCERGEEAYPASDDIWDEGY